MTRAVAVYGANGYTGRQVARELLARGRPVLLSGRSRGKLEALADELGGDVQVRPAGLDEGGGLRVVAEEAGAVINCAGPFVLSAQPVATAAIEGGAHYLDVSAEQHSAKWLFEQGDARARDAGVALFPACAFYSALSDMLVALLTAGVGPPEDVVVAYGIAHWRPSAASTRSRLEGMRREWFEYDGEVRAVHDWPPTTWFDFPQPLGRRRVAVYPTPEVFTIPRHTGARRVRTYLTTTTLTPAALGRFLPLLAKAAARLMRTPARPVVERLFARSWRTTGADRKTDDPTRFLIAVRVTTDGSERRASLSGRGIYDVTAPLVAEGADRLLEHGPPHPGALAAAEVFEPAACLDLLAQHGVSYEVDAAAEPVVTP
jgi:short subunit dehydrogenase-like uncharacterized protein